MSKNNGLDKKQQLLFSQAEINEMLESAPSKIRNYIDSLQNQISNMSAIGLALSKERDMEKLLEMILLEAKRISNADGGTLYMMTDDQRLRFSIMITDSLNVHMGVTSVKEITFYPVKLYNDDGKPNENMIAANAGINGKTINIPDAYKAKGFDFSGTKAFDEKTGYRSKSFLTVPLKNHENEIIGVLQLLNAQDIKSNKVISFSKRIQNSVEALSSQAAVAITNKNLIKDLEVLFESFIKLIASAIDAKSPYTGGHCSRVPEITMMLAESVNEINEGPFANIQFSDKEMYELKIAAWLHDCGKVATPEYVVDKSTKLETIYDRIHTVATRFEVIKRDEEIKFLKKQLSIQKKDSLSDVDKKEAIKKARILYLKRIKQLDEDKTFIEESNFGGEFMSQDRKDRVKKISSYRYKDNGSAKSFLSDNEVYNLCISRGTLTAEER